MPVILSTVSGHLIIEADGRKEDLLPGSVLHMTTRLPHAVYAVEASVLSLPMIDSRATPKNKPEETGGCCG